MKREQVVDDIDDDDDEEEEEVVCFKRKNKNKMKNARNWTDPQVVIDENIDEHLDDDDEDDDLEWARKQYSDSDESSNNNNNNNNNNKDFKFVELDEFWRKYEDENEDIKNLDEKERTERIFEAWYKQFDNVPPLYSNQVGELDTSNAALIKFNGRRLKKFDPDEYDFFIRFMYKCRQRCNLELFDHPGDPNIGGLGAMRPPQFGDSERQLAILAINKYQEVQQDEKLKLKELLKYNYGLWGTMVYFITFTAENEKTGQVKTYQAALAEYEDGDDDAYMLGLLRNANDSKVLAILAATGAKEDYVAYVERMTRG